MLLQTQTQMYYHIGEIKYTSLLFFFNYNVLL